MFVLGKLHQWRRGLYHLRYSLTLVSTDKLGKLSQLCHDDWCNKAIRPSSLTRHFNYGLHVFFSNRLLTCSYTSFLT